MHCSRCLATPEPGVAVETVATECEVIGNRDNEEGITFDPAC